MWTVRGGVVVAQLAVLVAVALATIWPAPVDSEKLPAAYLGSDLPLSHWPNALLLKQSVAEDGRLPLWNPHYGGGRPVAADPLAALWYPPSHLVHFFSLHDYFVVTVVLHLVLAGTGMLLLTRHAFGVSRLAALVAGVGYLATPRLVAHIGGGHLTMTMVAAWLPWCVLALWLTVRNPARWWVALAASSAMLLLAGHPQLAYYGGLMLTAVAGWLLFTRWRAEGREAALKSMAGLAAGGLTALLIASAHLLPLLEFMRHSTRQTTVGTLDATTAGPALKALAGDWMPSGVPHEAMFDPGRAVLALAVVGVLAWRRRALPIVVGIGVAFWLALGVDSLLYKVAAAIVPQYDNFRGVARVWFIGLIGIVVLAAAGVEALRRIAGRRHPWMGTVATLLVLVGVAVSLIQVAHGVTRVERIEPYVAPDEVTAAIAAEVDDGRVYGIQRNVSQGSAVTLGLELVDGQDPLLIESHAEFMEQAGNYQFDGYQLSIPPFQVYEKQYDTYQYPDPDPRLLALLGVTVVASWFPIDDPLLEEFAYIDNTHIYHVRLPTGRAWFQPEPATDRLTVDGIIRSSRPLTMSEHDAERTAFSFTAPADGRIILGWPIFPGWRAYLDGRRVDVESIDGSLPAVEVEAGTHRLVWVYEPMSVAVGKGLSAAGLLVATGWVLARALLPRWQTRRRAEPTPLAPQQPSTAD